jgi:hypothetical protein
MPRWHRFFVGFVKAKILKFRVYKGKENRNFSRYFLAKSLSIAEMRWVWDAVFVSIFSLWIDGDSDPII